MKYDICIIGAGIVVAKNIYEKSSQLDENNYMGTHFLGSICFQIGENNNAIYYLIEALEFLSDRLA